MKVTDLMINDWVLFNGISKKVTNLLVTDLGVDQIYVYGKSCHVATISEYIEPIPLTAEILERNGFVDCNTIGEKFELRIYLDKDDYRVISYYFATKGLSIKTEYSYSIRPTIEELRIKYVHELQHALKLCGIDKEIEL